MTEGADGSPESQNEVRKLEAQLWAPPLGEAPRGPWAPEAEMDAFRSLKTSLGQ